MTSPPPSQPKFTLDRRLEILLPELYRGNLESVRPVSMGSAGLQFDPDGRVAWDRIWGSFCDLALAGGPPHRGTLLQPGTAEQILAGTGRYQQVTAEIARGIHLVTHLEAAPSRTPGWVRVECRDATMAVWLGRAITAENVSATWQDATLELPAGPAFRIEKEIKNVITALAKTSHYWTQHTPRAQQLAISELFENLDQELPLLAPGPPISISSQHKLSQQIDQAIGLRPVALPCTSWIGLELGGLEKLGELPSAISLMRTLIASNVLARHEGEVLCLPLNATTDPDGSKLLERLIQAQEAHLNGK